MVIKDKIVRIKGLEGRTKKRQGWTLRREHWVGLLGICRILQQPRRAFEKTLFAKAGAARGFAGRRPGFFSWESSPATICGGSGRFSAGGLNRRWNRGI